MRRIGLLALALVFAGCHGSSSTDGGGTTGTMLQPGVVIGTDVTRLLFGEDYGNAHLLGTKPADTLQIMNLGTDDLVISSVTIVTGMDTDGGPLNDAADFSETGPDVTTVKGGGTAFVQVVFDSTIPNAPGRYGAILRIASNAMNSATLDIPMTIDIVTPMVSFLDGANTTVDMGSVALAQEIDGNGNPINYPDGGPELQVSYTSVDVYLVNDGTAQLQFMPAYDAVDGGAAEIFPCVDDRQTATNCGVAGPAPDSLDRIYPDGGLAIREVDYADGGHTYVGAARLTIDFQPAEPGSYTQHVIVDSNATDHPELVFTVTGTAHFP